MSIESYPLLMRSTFPLTMTSIVGRMLSKTMLYAFSVGCIASQNTYLEASVHTFVVKLLHKYEVSIYPVPQHPTLTSANPTTKIIGDQSVVIVLKILEKELKHLHSRFTYDPL
jgi:hypothetical protein